MLTDAWVGELGLWVMHREQCYSQGIPFAVITVLRVGARVEVEVAVVPIAPWRFPCRGARLEARR